MKSNKFTKKFEKIDWKFQLSAIGNNLKGEETK